MGAFDTFCVSTSCHGLSHFQSASKTISKFFWASLVLTLFFFLCWSNVNLMMRFFDSSDRWTTSSRENRSHLLEHPTINICNYNRFKRSKLQELGFPEEALEYLFFFNGAVRSLDFAPSYDPRAKEGYTAWRKAKNMTLGGLMDAGRHTCQDMVKFVAVSHAFYGRSFPIPEPCKRTLDKDSIEFRPAGNVAFGVDCVQLQVAGQYAMMQAMGQGTGTTLLLDVQPEEYVHLSRFNFADVGFALQPSYDGRMEIGGFINIAPGQHSWISMKQIKNMPGEAFESPFEAPCIRSGKLNYMQDMHYSSELCRFDCMMNSIVSCGQCYIVKIPGWPECQLEDLENCITQIMYNNNVSNSEQQKVEECLSGCKDLCEMRTIRSTVSYTEFPSESQLDNLRVIHPEIFGNKSIEEIRRRYALVDVFYSLEGVTLVEWRQVTSVCVMVGNLGGQMGLFLGVSIVTVVHFFTHFFSNLCQKIGRKKKKDKISIG